MSRVIDISQWQGSIDWETVKPNIDGAIIRCGWGSDYIGQDDTFFERNSSECERLGIPYGVYLYSYAQSVDAARSEAQHVLRLISGKNLSLPVYWDSEESGTEYNASAKAMVFCEVIRNAGYTPGVYASLSWWNAYLQGVSGVSIWCARWQSDSPGMECDIWQYTSDGSVPGITGRVDMNECYIDFGKQSAPIQLYESNGTDAQKWIPMHNADGTITLKSVCCNDKCLDVTGAMTDNETPLQIYKENGTDAQKFILRQITNDVYKPADIAPFEIIPAIDYNKRVEARHGNDKNGTKVQIYDANNTNAQQWYILDNGNGTWTICNNANGSKLMIDVIGAGK